jgi:uncharacterized protein DUF1918
MSDVWSEAKIGDAVSVESHRLHGSRRLGTIVETFGSPAHPYFRVRWQDGHETLFHPGADAVLQRDTLPSAAAKSSPPAKPPTRQPVVSTEPPPQQTRPRLRASSGDRLVIRGHRLGEPDRDGEILEVLGEEGGPPFRVRWSETGRVALLFPGADAAIEHYPRRRTRAVAKA